MPRQRRQLLNTDFPSQALFPFLDIAEIDYHYGARQLIGKRVCEFFDLCFIHCAVDFTAPIYLVKFP